jgi:hypothetical protein
MLPPRSGKVQQEFSEPDRDVVCPREGIVKDDLSYLSAFLEGGR